MRVLFVCSGNICRSPMAAECLRRRAAHSGLSHLVVESAGTLGIVDSPAAPEAVAALAEIGFDLESHRSRGLDRGLLLMTDLVLAMAGGHLIELASRHPDVGGPRWMLRAFEKAPLPDPDAPDLEDPIGRPLAVYRKQREIILRCVDHLVLYLRHQ